MSPKLDGGRKRLIGRFSVILLLSILLPNLPYFSPVQIVKPAHATSLVGLGVWSATYASSAIVDPTVTAGSTLQLRVNASGRDSINGFQITVSWDPAILNGTSVTNIGGLFDHPSFFPTSKEVKPYHVTMSGVLFNDFAPTNGTIITLTVKVLGVGSTSLRIESNTTLLNPARLPYSPLQGFFSNSPGTSDLLLASESASQENVTLGDKVSIFLGVRDVGAVPMTMVNVTLYANNVKINTTVLPAVPPNTETLVTFTWNTTGLSPGPYLMNATVATPSADAFPEDNTLALEQITLVIHELAMVFVMTTTNGIPYTPINASLVGSVVRIQVAVQNLGTVPEYANVTMYANNTATTYLPIQTECGNPPRPCRPTAQNPVHQGTTQDQFIFQWNTTGLRLGLYNFKGVVTVIPGERNVTNNVLVQGQVTLSAGFNHDLGVEWDPPNTVLYTGANFTFTLKVTNNGKFNDSFTLTLFSNSTRLLITTGTAIVSTKYTTTVVWKTATTAPGRYRLLLNVTDNSAKDEYPFNNTLTSSVLLNLNHPPVASFTFTPSAPKAGDSVFFNATLSNDPDSGQRIKYYIWNFGDGTVGNGKTLNHTYTAAGSYAVNLTVWDDSSAAAWLSKTVVVLTAPTTGGNSFLLYIAAGIAVAAIGAGGVMFYMFSRRKKSTLTTPKTTSTS